MSKVQEVKKAMIALGYPKTEHIELEELDANRSKVIYDGHLRWSSIFVTLAKNRRHFLLYRFSNGVM